MSEQQEHSMPPYSEEEIHQAEIEAQFSLDEFARKWAEIRDLLKKAHESEMVPDRWGSKQFVPTKAALQTREKLADVMRDFYEQSQAITTPIRVSSDREYRIALNGNAFSYDPNNVYGTLTTWEKPSALRDFIETYEIHQRTFDNADFRIEEWEQVKVDAQWEKQEAKIVKVRGAGIRDPVFGQSSRRLRAAGKSFELTQVSCTRNIADCGDVFSVILSLRRISLIDSSG